VRPTIFVFLILTLLACRKEKFTNDPSARLNTSEDTLHFDTVFTTTGSTTQFFKIINNNDESIHVGSIRVAGGASSPFRLNADGIEGPVVSGVEIGGRDSAYVFVTVQIDPSSEAVPFLVRDSILIDYNGNTSTVQLEAYGQNAHFIRSHTIDGREEWNNDLPYVILGGLMVTENGSLRINKGCRVFVHADAPLVVAGNLEIAGEQWDSTRVVITGDRMDAPYRDFPASWPGIVFTAASHDNLIRFALIKNAFQAIAVQGMPATSLPKLVLEETIIDNAYDAGIIGIGSRIQARNILVSNSGKNILLLQGGDYNFEHATIAAYPNNFYQRRDPMVFISDNLENNSPGNYALNARFQNCIFWGESGGLVKDEILLRKRGSLSYQVVFDHVLWSLKANPALATLSVPAIQTDPGFVNIDPFKKIYDFHLKESSAALNKGLVSGVPLDLDGNPRPVGDPDLGAYEKQ
jgi:hypothetical protein